jgi:tRNA A-37 threonylcarbamoyl transferase component Bud32
MYSKLGRFEIMGMLGRGAMGEVYLGVDPVLGREVAIKTVIASALPEELARQRFYREAQAAAVLTSPHIVTIHELGEDQGVLFIAMERLKGQDLEQILLQRGLTLPEFLEVLAQVCDGLDTAHRHHILHRDIKPSNIMVMREGRRLLAKIMDFGVARLKDSTVTLSGTVMGTVNYIAPEYIRNGEPDGRSDLFAVGVMLYECIAGKRPFEGGSASTILGKIASDPPDPLELYMLQGLSPALRNMTEKALAKDPDDRFQSGEEFALALRAAKQPGWSGKLEETTVRMKIQPVSGTAASPAVDPLAGRRAQSPAAEAVDADDTDGPLCAPRGRYTTQQFLVAPAPAPASVVVAEGVEAAKAGTQEIVVASSPVSEGVQDHAADDSFLTPPSMPAASADEGPDLPSAETEGLALGRVSESAGERIDPSRVPERDPAGAETSASATPPRSRRGRVLLAAGLITLGLLGVAWHLLSRSRPIPLPPAMPGESEPAEPVPVPEAQAPSSKVAPQAPLSARRIRKPKPATPKSAVPATEPPPVPQRPETKAAPTVIPSAVSSVTPPPAPSAQGEKAKKARWLEEANRRKQAREENSKK